MWYVYLLRCSDNSFYTGVTIDLKKRVLCHNSGKGARYTRLRRPVVLEYAEKFDNKKAAEIREIEIKDLSYSNKEYLIKYGTGEGFPSARQI